MNTSHKDLLAKIDKAERLFTKLEQRRGFTSEQREHYDAIATEIDTYKAAVTFDSMGNAEAKAMIKEVKVTIAGIEKWLNEPLPPGTNPDQDTT